MNTTTKTSRDGKHQASGCWIRTDKRLAIYLRDRFTCIYCLRDLHDADPTDISLDHVTNERTNGKDKTMTTKTKRKITPARELPGVFIRAENHEIKTIKTAARVARQSMTQYAVAALVAAAKKTLENNSD